MGQPRNSSISDYMTRMLVFNTFLCGFYVVALLISPDLVWAQLFGILMAITHALFFVVIRMVVVDKEWE